MLRKVVFRPTVLTMTIQLMTIMWPINESSEIEVAENSMSTTLPTSHSTPAPKNETVLFSFNPSSINDLLKDSNATIYFNCSLNHQYVDTSSQISLNVNDTYLLTVESPKGEVLQLFSYRPEKDLEFSPPYLRNKIIIHVSLVEENNFTVLGLHIGIVTMSLSLLNTNSYDMAKAGLAQTISRSTYDIRVVREQKISDFVFNCSAAAVAILISFGIGCVTDTDHLKQQLKYPVSLLIGFCCQFLIMPVMSFGIAVMLPMEQNVRFGLLCVACVPGGGLGHVAVIISQSDVPLSLTMNLVGIVAMLGTAPLWIFVLGQKFFQINEGSKIIPIYHFEIWLASIFFAYTAGLIINCFKPVVADAILTWIIKPFLLLVTILYITLGVYINMYVFEVIDVYALLAALMLPLCGFLLGYVMAIICRQKSKSIISIALETSSMNCLIVLAAIRFSLQPFDADQASTVPIWVTFTSPGFYAFLAVVHAFKKCTDNFVESRKQTKFRHFSIASGIVNPANMAALSAPLFVTEGLEDDQGSVSEKITVL